MNEKYLVGIICNENGIKEWTVKRLNIIRDRFFLNMGRKEFPRDIGINSNKLHR